MQDKYLNRITKLLEQVSPKLSTKYRLEFKNVFGAVGGYVMGLLPNSHLNKKHRSSVVLCRPFGQLLCFVFNLGQF